MGLGVLAFEGFLQGFCPQLASATQVLKDWPSWGHGKHRINGFQADGISEIPSRQGQQDWETKQTGSAGYQADSISLISSRKNHKTAQSL